MGDSTQRFYFMSCTAAAKDNEGNDICYCNTFFNPYRNGDNDNECFCRFWFMDKPYLFSSQEEAKRALVDSGGLQEINKASGIVKVKLVPVRVALTCSYDIEYVTLDDVLGGKI